jgi:hypothetical protein
MPEALSKGAVVVMDAAKPESWLIVPAQTDVQAVAEKIGLSNASRE